MIQFWLTVVIPIMLGCLMNACSNILKRYLLKNKKLSPLQFLIVGYGLISCICAVAYVAIWGFEMPPRLLPKFWSAVFAGAAANFVIQFLNAKAASLDKGEVSLTAPLQAMTPFMITMLALTLGEYPGRIGALGVLCMMCGSYALLWEGNPQHWYDYLGPLKRLRLILRIDHVTDEEWNKTLVVCMALGSAAMGTIGLLFDGLYTRRGVDIQGLMMAIIVLIGALSVGYALWYLVKPDATLIQHANFFSTISGKRFTLFLLLFAAACVSHWLLVQPTFNKAFIAYVGTLKRFHILFGVILGHLIFKEGDFKKRMWVAVIIIIGAILISMDGLPLRLTDKVIGLGF